MRLHYLRNYRFWLNFLAMIALVVVLFKPEVPIKRERPDFFFVIDITGSMNVRDYVFADRARSRLDQAKHVITETLGHLACGSRAGLAAFSERRVFLMIEPVEICNNYDALVSSLHDLDWRMAWEGDSYIAQGVYDSIALAQVIDSSPIFISDGHEAPPLPAVGGPQFTGNPEATHGLLVGAGGDELSPIPKFDDLGNEIGFYEMDEVVQENRHGLPPAEVQEREGWHPRNAPFGIGAPEGNEHLSSVKRDYLQKLADSTGMGYVDLRDSQTMISGIEKHILKRSSATFLDLRPYLGGLAGILILLYYMSALWPRRNIGFAR